MELVLIFFVYGFSVSESEEHHRPIESNFMTLPPSKEQSNSGHNNVKVSNGSPPHPTVALITSPGTDLFHALDERPLSTAVDGASAEDMSSTRGEGVVSGRGSGAFASSMDSISGTHRIFGAALPLISNVQEEEEEQILTSSGPGSGPAMNGTVMATARLSGGEEKIAAWLHAALNSENQRVTESITLLPAKSVLTVSATDPAMVDNLGEAFETVGSLKKRPKENGARKTGTTHPPNSTESNVSDKEETFEQKGGPAVTALLNGTHLDVDDMADSVKTDAQEPGEMFRDSQPEYRSFVTHRSGIFNVDFTSTLEPFRQEVIKEKDEIIMLLPITVSPNIRVYTNDKLHASKFYSPSDIPYQRTTSPVQSHSLLNTVAILGQLQVTSPVTKILLQRVAGHESKSTPASHSLTSEDGRVVTTAHSPFQTAQTSAPGKDEEMYKFLTIHPKMFTDRPSVLIKVKNVTHSENGLLTVPPHISSANSQFFQMPEGSSYPQREEIYDRLSLIDNRTEHFHTLVNKLILGASSSAPFAIARRVMTESAHSRRDLTALNGKILIRLTPSALIMSSNNMHQSVTSDQSDQLQKMSTTDFQPLPRQSKNVFPKFEGHTVTYSPVKQLLIPSLTSSPLTSLSRQPGHVPFQSARDPKESSLISPLGHAASASTSVPSQSLEKLQSLTSSHSANKNRERPVYQKLLASHSERITATTDTWSATGNSSVNPAYAQFIRTVAGLDKRNDLLLSVSSTTSTAHPFNSTLLESTAEKNLSITSLWNKLKLFFLPPSLQKTSGDGMLSTSLQDLVQSSSQTVVSKPLEITETGEIDRIIQINQISANEHNREKLASHSEHRPTSVSLQTGTQEQKNAGESESRGVSSTHSPSKVQSQPGLSGLLIINGKSSSLVTQGRKSQNAFSMQNKSETPVTLERDSTVSSSQSRAWDAQQTEGQINTSVSPAAIENFPSTQPLAYFTTAETPKKLGQMINHASAFRTTSASIMAAASNEKDISGISTSQKITQSTSTRDLLRVLIENMNNTERLIIPVSTVKHVALNLPSSPPPTPSTVSMNSALPAHGIKMQSASLPPSSAPSSMTDRAHQRTSGPQILSSDAVEMNAIERQSAQTTLPVTEATFFAIDTDVSLAGPEIKGTESPQTASLQISEVSEGRLSVVTPFELSSMKSTDLMSDLSVKSRRVRIASPDFLSGLAQISDDICGSGNYTAEMRLNLERDIMPGDLVPALGNLHVVINLKTNNSQVNLEIKSCCLSPTVTVDEFNTTCCLFSRLPVDPQGIRLLPSVLSKRASFTISLFQMINYSTAYLHCDLSVCLRNHSERERLQRNTQSVRNNEIIFSSAGNRISFGPVLKETDESSLARGAAADAETMVILGSVSGCSLVCVAALLLLMINRHHLKSSSYGSLESFTYFKKDDFEVDWDKVSDRSFGQVYKGKLKLWREQCAIKTFSNSADYKNMLQVSKVGKMKFRYLISIYGLCKDPEAIVMEYMNKGSLDNLLTTHVLMWPKKFQMIHEVTMGMNFLHSMQPPLLHLNLKLANILLDDHLHVKISDFGLVKWEEASDWMAFIEQLTARGNIGYVPPETFTQNPEPPSPKYDVYSFSIVMWEILTQKRPYSGVNMTEILIRVSSGKRPSLEKIPDDKPQECVDMIDIMQQCWYQDCSQRPAFSETVRETEALSDLLKIPDMIPGKENKSVKLKSVLSTLRRGSSADVPDGLSGDAPRSIHSYLKQKDFETFKKLVRKEHVSMLFTDRNTLLHHVAASGDVDSVRLVLDLDATVNCQSVEGYTPLIVAIHQKFHEVCALLLECGADCNLGDRDSWTALHFASQSGDDRAVRLLLDNAALADVKEKDGWTPLHLACQNGHESVVRHLLPRIDGVDSCEDRTGRTALHMACAYGHLRIVKLLLAKGADPNGTDDTQATALHLAAEEGHFRVVRLLVANGANVKSVDERHYSALHFAALRGCTGICRHLLSNGEDPDVRTHQNWTAMHLAALKGHPETVLVLEENKGSVDARGEDGWTPLLLACQHRQENVVADILVAGADPNLAEDGGWTALHLVSNNGAFNSALQLITRGADVNAQNGNQDTPLHLAVQASSTAIIKALLMNGAKKDIANSRGRTALELAQQCGNEEIVQLLNSV